MIAINRVGDDEGVACDSASTLWLRDFRQLPLILELPILYDKINKLILLDDY